MNTISYKELKRWYTQNDEARELAKSVFGTKQPSIYRTGFYSAPSWNWAYLIGLADITRNGITTTYEVVTQFGGVVAAREVFIPIENYDEEDA